MILDKLNTIGFVFETLHGKKITASITVEKVMELMEEYAYELVTNPRSECNSSSCNVNGFCECDPINEDAELQYLTL